MATADWQSGSILDRSGSVPGASSCGRRMWSITDRSLIEAINHWSADYDSIQASGCGNATRNSQPRLNVGPASETLAQHSDEVGSCLVHGSPDWSGSMVQGISNTSHECLRRLIVALHTLQCLPHLYYHDYGIISGMCASHLLSCVWKFWPDT